ncbi:hypothetical protein H7X87_03715 [Acetobacteraceae bacterium]|nr:hypothetical protein [Candidatus Parcubacteria bacterium]
MGYHRILGGLNPEEAFVCQISDSTRLEQWVAQLASLPVTAKEQHWCAMCCVRSLLIADGLDAPSLEELFDRACAAGVYREDAEIGWRGAYHHELAEFVSTLHPQGANAVRGMSTVHNGPRGFSLGQYIGFGHYVLLSVHPDIRLRSNEPVPVKRGHFVFIYGFRVMNGTEYFVLHNPAGFATESSQIGMLVSSERLIQVSDGDGIVVLNRGARPRLW